MSDIAELLAIMARLRDPDGGCPWDLQQDFATIAPYTIEEAYEVADAIDRGDMADLRDELGDLLLQVVYHARMAEEEKAFSFGDVVEAVTRKMIRRHPHVFGDTTATTAEDVEANWHALKAKEKGRASVTDGIPASLPALVLAGKVLQRTTAFTDEIGPSAQHDVALAAIDGIVDEETYGDLLLALVSIARDAGWDSEAAVRGAVRRRMDAVRAIEQGP